MLIFYFSTVDSLLMLYFALVRSELEYASVDCNSVIITDPNNLERIQRKFAALCHNRIFQHMGISLLHYIRKIKFRYIVC
jgi:hypothetical protein